jgi:hypothetical protein
VPQWAWTAGTPWRIVSSTLFGTPAPGRIVNTNYQNGYFSGAGIGPTGGTAANFTLLGSVTPEGNVLFNTLSHGTLASLYGAASGDASGAQMLVGSYDLSGNPTGAAATLSLVRPYAETLQAQNAPGSADALYRLSTTSLGWSGAMAEGFVALDNLRGLSFVNAVNQTLPVLTGAASQATYATQRAFQQAVAGRLDDVLGLNGAIAPERNFWMKPLGGVFAYSHQTITGSEDAVPSRLAIDSYQAGLYGACALGDGIQIDGQLDGAVNDNGESRSLNFINSTAGAGYRSLSGRASAAIRKLIPIVPGLAISPSLRLDYGQVSSPAYQESGAGGFGLNVDAQTYRELTLTAGMKGARRIAPQVYLTGDVGVGYNTLNQGLQITSAFAGGGNSFTTGGVALSPWIYSTALGLVAADHNRFDLGLRYGLAVTSSGLLQQSGLAVLRVKL